jgi:hypothetical protein
MPARVDVGSIRGAYPVQGQQIAKVTTMATNARARIARDASALPLAGGAYAVVWESDGAPHVAFVDTLTGIPAATMAMVAVARDGTIIAVETALGEDEAA